MDIKKMLESLKEKIFEILPKDKDEITILVSSTYGIGVLFQIFKLIFSGENTPNILNLMFFSFTNSLNDFVILFGSAIIFFLLSSIFMLIKFIPKKLNPICYIIGCMIIFGPIIYFYYSITKTIMFFIMCLLPYIFSAIISYYIITETKKTKSFFYTFLVLFLFHSFFMMLIYGNTYSGCFDNNDKNCIKLEYKNDKYGFTSSGIIYKIDEFKSFNVNNTTK